MPDSHKNELALRLVRQNLDDKNGNNSEEPEEPLPQVKNSTPLIKGYSTKECEEFCRNVVDSHVSLVFSIFIEGICTHGLKRHQKQ